MLLKAHYADWCEKMYSDAVCKCSLFYREEQSKLLMHNKVYAVTELRCKLSFVTEDIYMHTEPVFFD